MATAALSPARALGQTRRADARAVFGILLMLATVVASLAFWINASDTRTVVVATRDLAAGATLQRSDLGIARVRVDDAIYNAAVGGDGLESLVGKPLREPVHAQQLLARAQLSTRPPIPAGQVAMTIAASSANAAGGSIQIGDTVQVLQTLDKGKPTSKTSVVVPQTSVYDVGYDDRSAVVNTNPGGDARAVSRPISTLTLIVSPEQALQLGQARWNGDLDVVLLPPQG